ncbi:MAG: PDZ domain-containing protein [Phycisphaerales bacterium]|nr:PDZ domain-containing protein [Phycisphaerales bacterium]
MVPLLVHAVCISVALAAAAGEPRPIKDVVADLGSSDFKARETATDELTTNDFTLAQIEAALKDPTLTAEQRTRLERAGLRHFKDIPHGALGVEFTGAIDVAEIANVKKGFPSAATLKAGDIITQIDGEPITSRISNDRRSSTVRALVVSHDPGDEVPVVVQRNGQPVKLIVKFGDFKDLNDAFPAPNPAFIQSAPAIDESEFQAAWRQRLKRNTGHAEPEPIDTTALRPRRDAAWGGGQAEAVDIIDAANRARAATGDTPSVTVGASPDQERFLDRADAALSGGWQERSKGGIGFARAFNGGGRAPMPVGGINVQQEPSKQSDGELAAERMQLIQLRMIYLQMADQPRLDRAQRQQFVMLDEQIRNQIGRIDAEITRRKAAKLPIKPGDNEAPAELMDPNRQPDQKADKP